MIFFECLKANLVANLIANKVKDRESLDVVRLQNNRASFLPWQRLKIETMLLVMRQMTDSVALLQPPKTCASAWGDGLDTVVLQGYFAMGATRILCGYAPVEYAGDTRRLDNLWLFQSNSPIRWILEILYVHNFSTFWELWHCSRLHCSHAGFLVSTVVRVGKVASVFRPHE